MSDDTLLNPPGKRPVFRRDLVQPQNVPMSASDRRIQELEANNATLAAEVARLNEALATVTAERDEARELNRKTSWMGEGYALVEARAEAAEAARDKLTAQLGRLQYVLGGVRRAIKTGRNEPLQIWAEQIDIAFAALEAGQ